MLLKSYEEIYTSVLPGHFMGQSSFCESNKIEVWVIELLENVVSCSCWSLCDDSIKRSRATLVLDYLGNIVRILTNSNLIGYILHSLTYLKAKYHALQWRLRCSCILDELSATSHGMDGIFEDMKLIASCQWAGNNEDALELLMNHMVESVWSRVNRMDRTEKRDIETTVVDKSLLKQLMNRMDRETVR